MRKCFSPRSAYPRLHYGSFLFLCALAAVLLTGCGALSTHQSPKVLEPNRKSWVGGVGGGRLTNCVSDTSGKNAYGNGCVLTLDPYVGFRLGLPGAGDNTTDLAYGAGDAEAGIKFSGVPFLGGTMLADVRVQKLTEPIYLTYDFGLSFMPCLSGSLFSDDDTPDNLDQNKKHDCGDNPFAGGIYAGSTFGTEWLYAGVKYGIGGNTWDGLQLLPGVNVGSAIGPKRFKINVAVDVYFYQWPVDPSPSLRVIYGVGFQTAY